ncbi:Ger(x)C family spore germination protein [Gottfriedia acidiceleris]|uniref:Ger(x)C family spore germination protein n=1 Tax=Gottfriedia acidiceleris TaxID=371036 RepID=UPI003D1B368D
MKGFWLFIPLLLTLSILFNNKDRTEINEIGSVISLGIAKENDLYHLTVQLANAGAKNANSKSMLSPITTFDGDGKTLTSALYTISDQMPKNIDLSHLQLVLISEDLLKKEGLGPVIDFLIRAKKTSNHYPIAVVKENKPEEMLKIFTPIQDFPAMDIRNMILNISEQSAQSVFTSPINVLIDLYKEGSDLFLPDLEVNGDIKAGGTIENTQSLDPKTTIKLSGFSLFHDSEYAGSISIRETFLYFITQGKVKNAVLETICSDHKKAVLKINSIRAKKELIGNKNPSIKLSLTIDGTLVENNCNYITRSNFTKTEKELENKYKTELTNSLNNLIRKTKEYNSDLFGFGNIYYIKHPQKWEKVQSDFLKNVDVNTKVSINIRQIGTINFNDKFPSRGRVDNEANNTNQ